MEITVNSQKLIEKLKKEIALTENNHIPDEPINGEFVKINRALNANLYEIGCLIVAINNTLINVDVFDKSTAETNLTTIDDERNVDTLVNQFKGQILLTENFINELRLLDTKLNKLFFNV